MPCIRPTKTDLEYLRLFEKDRCCCRESGTAAVFFWSGFGWQGVDFLFEAEKADKFSTILWKTEQDFLELRLFGVSCCVFSGILPQGLPSFITERRK